MVVQCPNCQARFKLADDKVTAKGVKIRCSKCANVFTVKPEDGVDGGGAPKPVKSPVPEAPAAKEPAGAKPSFKDFNFADFADVSTKSKAGAPPPDKAPPPKPVPPPKPAAKTPATEADEDLSDFFSAGDAPVASAKPAPPKPAAKPVPKPAAPKPAAAPADPFGDFDGTPPPTKKAVPAGGDGLDDLFASAPPPPPQAKPKPAPKPPAPPPPAPKPAAPKPAPKPPPKPAPEPETDEPDFGGDIELDTSRSGADGFSGVFADAPPPPATGGKSGGSEDSFDSLIGTGGSAFDDAPPPPPAGGSGGGGGIELDMSSSKTLEFLQRAGETSRKKVVQVEGPNLGLIIGIAAGVFLFLVIGFRAMVEFAPESVPGISLETARSIREVVPFPVTNPDFPEPAPKIEARVDQTYPVTNLAGEVIYVATGKLVNRSGAPMNFLRVKLRLVDKQGQTLQEKTVFAGNVVSLDRLQKTDPKEVDTEFQRKLGANNSNMNVGNNTTVNFMGIFYQYGGDPASVQIVEATAGN